MQLTPTRGERPRKWTTDSDFFQATPKSPSKPVSGEVLQHFGVQVSGPLSQGTVGGQFRRLTEGIPGVLPALLTIKSMAQPEVGIGVVGIDLDGSGPRCQGLVKIALGFVGDPQIGGRL